MEEKKPRGFAAMDPEKQRALARKGAAACSAAGKRHKFSSELAARAGRIGGLATQERARAKRAERDQAEAPEPARASAEE